MRKQKKPYFSADVFTEKETSTPQATLTKDPESRKTGRRERKTNEGFRLRRASRHNQFVYRTQH